MEMRWRWRERSRSERHCFASEGQPAILEPLFSRALSRTHRL
jgi:hypothetical protein